MRARVRIGGRLHFGFLNLSLARDRLYGGLGVALDRPETVVCAASADSIEVVGGDGGADPSRAGVVEEYARRSVDLLGVPGARVEVRAALPRHVGLGSGTRLALATYAAIARAHDREFDVREAAPALDRGGRSGVGVATFERGGFVIDAGHPAERFTTDRPAPGEWEVPPVASRHDVPGDWRFVVVLPEVRSGRSGEAEDESMRSIVERADPGIADEIAALVTGRLLPAIAEDDPESFGAAIAEVNRLNGVWYAGEQGGVYRPPVGPIVDELAGHAAIFGAGQSSWGPGVFGVTDARRIDEAIAIARGALDATGIEGDVLGARPGNAGATIEVE